jgi:hypothetical protein
VQGAGLGLINDMVVGVIGTFAGETFSFTPRSSIISPTLGAFPPPRHRPTRPGPQPLGRRRDSSMRQLLVVRAEDG